jgi:ABC-type amino acid transport substrate-binding protein
MRMIAFKLLGVALFSVGALLGWKSSPSIADDNVITIGTEGSWKPYSYMDSAGNLIGFEVELARAVCEKAGLKCEVIVVPWESLIPALQEEKIDAIASGMRMTAKRMKVVDFTLPWYKSSPSFASCKHKELSDNSPETLKGMIVGVQAGGNNEDFLRARYPNLDIRAYKKIDDIYADLHSGRLDIAYGGKPTIYDFLQTEKGSDCGFVGTEVTDKEFYSEPNSIALRKGDTVTKEKLDKGVKAILEDGSFEEINARYWPFSLRYTVPAN